MGEVAPEEVIPRVGGVGEVPIAPDFVIGGGLNAELRFSRRLGEKCLEELDNVDAPAFRAFPLPFLVLLEGEDFLEAVVAFPAFVRVCGHGITSLPARPGRPGGFYIRKDYNMNRTYSGYCAQPAEGVTSDAFGEAEAMKISIPLITIAASVLSVALHPALATDDPYLQKRTAMVRDQIEREGVTDPRVLTAMRDVPRHLFVPSSFRAKAYDPYPLPIGEGQTISQPYIVGFMTQILRLKETDRVLEVGTGSGYQAAVASRLAAEVYSVEILESLAARSRRDALGNRVPQRGRPAGGRLLRLGGEGAVRRHHRDLRGGTRPPASSAPAQERGSDDHARRRALHDPEPRLHRKGRPGRNHA